MTRSRAMPNLRQLVDGPWYLARYEDVAATAADPVDHYLNQGWRERRQPSRFFDPVRCHVAGDRPARPLVHYLRTGEDQGRRPSAYFDPAWYRRTYAVPHAENCLLHYMRNRASGGVSPNPLFDAAFYRRANPDVVAAGMDPFEHFLLTGRGEGRLPMPAIGLVAASGVFDANFYLINAADVLDAGVDPAGHFCETGWRENRNPNPYFSVAWYRTAYPGRLHPNPLVDYVLDGEQSGRRPGPNFDPAWYRQRNALLPETLALTHWLAHRRSQRLSPMPDFDVANHVATAGSRLRPGRDPFLQALIGDPQGRQD